MTRDELALKVELRTGIFRAICRDGDYRRITSALQKGEIDHGEGLLIYLGGVTLRNRKWVQTAVERDFLSLAAHWSSDHGNMLADRELVTLVHKFMHEVVF